MNGKIDFGKFAFFALRHNAMKPTTLGFVQLSNQTPAKHQILHERLPKNKNVKRMLILSGQLHVEGDIFTIFTMDNQDSNCINQIQVKHFHDLILHF